MRSPGVWDVASPSLFTELPVAGLTEHRGPALCLWSVVYNVRSTPQWSWRCEFPMVLPTDFAVAPQHPGDAIQEMRPTLWDLNRPKWQMREQTPQLHHGSLQPQSRRSKSPCNRQQRSHASLSMSSLGPDRAVGSCYSYSFGGVVSLLQMSLFSQYWIWAVARKTGKASFQFPFSLKDAYGTRSCHRPYLDYSLGERHLVLFPPSG